MLLIAALYILILGTFYYFGIFKYKSAVTVNFILMALLAFIFGIFTGKNANQKGYIEGMKKGGLSIALLILMNLLFYRHFSLSIALYYIIIVIGCTSGSMLGINLKRH